MHKVYRVKPLFAYMLGELAHSQHRTLTGQLELCIQDAFNAAGLKLSPAMQDKAKVRAKPVQPAVNPQSDDIDLDADDIIEDE